MTGQTNVVLNSLPPKDHAFLRSKLKLVDLPAGSVLFEAERTPLYAHFLTSGLAALETPLEAGRSAVSDIVGREGIPEVLHVFGLSETIPRCSIQVDSTALRMPFSEFQEFAARSSLFQRQILRLVQFQTMTNSRISICNSLHDVEPRFARCILMLFDRLDERELPITQECIARMLGASRTTVSMIAHQLKTEGLIRYSRNVVAIIDRQSLEHKACECYAPAARFLESFVKMTV